MVVVVLGASACGNSEEPRGSITVSAAASLRGAFTEIGEAFTAANPDTKVVFNFDSSASLATQILEGAPASVFASADNDNMARLMYLEAVSSDVEVFALNQMVIVTKPGNPEGIAGLSDLASVGVVSLCGQQVPCGRYAADVLANAGVAIDESNVTRGQNATATLAAVTQGDAVAGIVYGTDAVAAGDSVEVIELPAGVNVTAAYTISVVSSAGNEAGARAFIDFLQSDQGQSTLVRHGFLPR